MAIYHANFHIIKRSKGQSAVASSAYRSGKKLYDEREGLSSKKRGHISRSDALRECSRAVEKRRKIVERSRGLREKRESPAGSRS